MTKSELTCPISEIEITTAGEHCRASFKTQASDCPLCRGREGSFGKDSAGYEVFRPCSRRHAKRRVELYNTAKIGRRYATATFDTYQPQNASQSTALQRARDWPLLYNTSGAKDGLLFWGPVGTGKTHLVLSIFRELTLNAGIPARFVDYGNLLMDLRRSFRAEAGSSEAALMLPLVETEVLIIDELGKGRNTEWELTVLDDLVSRRYNAHRATLFTTNLVVGGVRQKGSGFNPAYDQRRADSSIAGGAETLEERLDGRIYSRLCEMAVVVPVEGNDWRRRATFALSSSSASRAMCGS